MITAQLFLGGHFKVSEGEKERSFNGSSELEPQSKNWLLELKLKLLVLCELSQSCGSISAFRKGLVTSFK